MSFQLVKHLIWLFVAVIIAIAVQIPMFYHGQYLFTLPNTLIISLPIWYVRCALDFYQISYHKKRLIRYFIIAGNILLAVYLINRVEVVMGLVDSMDIYQLIKTKHFFGIDESAELLSYIKSEYLFFTIATIFSTAFYIIKIIGSFWKKSQLKTSQKL